jgi:predicted O-methyltransferase YrrM
VTATVDVEGAARLLGELADGAFALAAVAAALRPGEPDVVLDDAPGSVLGALGLAAPRDGHGWALTPAMAAIAARNGPYVAGRYTALLRWAAAAAEGRPGWAEQDGATKSALGRASGRGGSAIVNDLAPRLGDLAARLARPGTAALDVGTGVAELAVGLAEAAPALRVVGIDVLDDVLAVARRTVADCGLADRVELRRQDVATLAEVHAFDLAYLPAHFVAVAAVEAALPRIMVALRPGGWLVVPVRQGDGTELAATVTAWTYAGCACWNAAETQQRLRAAGFVDLQGITLHPTAPEIVAGSVP